MSTKSLSAKSLSGGRAGLTLSLIAGRALRSRFAWGGVFSSGLLAMAGVAVGQVQGVAGEQVAAGQARFVRFGNSVTITAANNTIINYNSFNIRAGESVNFVQPDALARVLNRINSAEPTRVDGSLSANGRVYIVNPAGVFFGPGAVVNTGSLYAAAGNLSNADFLRNINRFTNINGKVINEGTINTAPGGVAALVGSAAMNFGTISAPQGTIIMASGSSVLIGEEGGHVYAQIDTAQATGAGPEGGQSAPATQKARFGAGDTLAVAVFNKGVAKAGRVQMETSRGVTVASGTIDVSDTSAGGKGGSVELLGDRVALVDATIDASGDAKGGQVLIGGDLQGKGAQRNAALANVDSTSVVHADAISSGDGGKVIVWSDDTTKFQGLVTARGGAQGGNGGFVEISGAQYLHAAHNVDLSAPKGNAGTVLYDPLNILIDGSAGGNADGSDDTDASATNLINDSGSNTQGTITYTDEGAGPPDPFIVTESEIEGTNANIILQARNSILTNGDFAGDELTIATGRNLTLETRNNAGDSAGAIDLTGSAEGVNLNIRTQGAGTITINASTDGASAGAIDLCGLTTAGGLISVTTGNGTLTSHGSVATSGGAITFLSTGDLTLNANLAASGGDVLLQSSAGQVSQAAATSITGSTLGVRAATGISLPESGNSFTSFAAFTSGAGAPINYRDTSALNVTDVLASGGFGGATGVSTTTNGTITLQTGGSLALLNDLNSGSGAMALTAGTGTVSEAGGVITATGTLTLGGGASFNLDAVGNDLGSVTGTVSGTNVSLTDGTGTLTLDTFSHTNGAGAFTAEAVTGNIIDTTSLTLAGTGSFTTGTANSTITLDNLAATGAVDVHTSGATGNATIVNTIALNLATSAVGGNLVATASTGNLTDSGAATVGGTGTFTTSASNATITLDQLGVTGPVVLSTGASGNATIVNSIALDLGASTLGGSLSATSDDIDLVGGAASVTSSTLGSTITLASRTAGTSIGVGTGAGSLSINATDLAAIGSFTGGLTIGNSSGTAALTIGAASFTRSTTLVMSGAGGSIATTGGTTLTMAGSNLSFDAGSVSLAGTLTGGASTIRIKSAGAVTQTAGSIGASVLGVSAGGAITLDSSTNAVTTFAAFSSGAGSAISYRDTNGLTIGNVTALGTFGATFGVGTTSNGAITLRSGSSLALSNSVTSGTGLMTITVDAGTFADSASGFVLAPGTLSLNGGSSLTFVNLSRAGNSIGTLSGSFTGTSSVVTLRDGTGSLDLNGFSHIGSSGVVTLQVDNGGITDSGIVTIAGSLGLQAQSDIALNNTLSVSGPLSLHTIAGNATIINQVGIDLTPHVSGDITGNLSLTAVTGNITDSGGSVIVTGTGTFTTQATDADILLDEPISIGGAITLNTTGATGNATIDNASAVNLAASSVGGNLSVTASAGNITDSGAVTVGGTGSFTTSTSGAAINLDQLAVTGAIDLHTIGTGDATITNASAVDLAASSIGRDLSVTASSGAITDSGAITIGRSGLFTTTSADITLDQVSAPSGSLGFTTNISGNVTLTMPAATSVAIGASTVNGNVVINADNVDFTGGNDSVGISGTLDILPITTTREIVLGTSGTGTQLVLDDTDLDALADGIDLITIGRTNSNANSTIDAFSITDPLYVRTLSGGTMSITGAVAASGDSTLTFLTGGTLGLSGSLATSTQDVLLLSTGAMTLGGNINTSGATLRLVTGPAAGVTQSAGSILNSSLGVRAGSIALTSSGNTISNAAGFAQGSGSPLSLRSGSSLTSASIGADTLNIFTATSGLAATGGDILVHAPSLAISQQIFTAGGTVRLQTVTGVTQTAAITADALGVVASGAGDISLAGASNNVATVALSAAGAGNTVNYTDADALALGAVSASGTFTGATGISTNNGDATLSSGDLDIPQSIGAGSGTVRIVSSGAVTQTAGTITALGLGVRAGGAVTLNQGNSVTTFAANSSGAGSAVQYTDASGVDLGTISAFGAFSSTSGLTTSNGDVLVAAGGAVTIPQSISAGSGTVRIVSSGAVSQSAGTITASSLGVTSTGAITLEQSTNNVTTFAAFSSGAGSAISYRDTNALNIGSVSASGAFLGATGVGTTSNGAITLRSGGNLALFNSVASGTGLMTITVDAGTFTDSPSGVVLALGTLNLNGGSGVSFVNLDEAASSIGTLSGSFTGTNTTVTLRDGTGSLDLNGFSHTGTGGVVTLQVDSAGITDSGTVTVAGSLGLQAQSDIVLNNTLTLSGPLSLHTTAGNASIINQVGIDLTPHINGNINGNLTLTAVTGDITDSGGTTTVIGTGTFTTQAPNADIVLGDAISPISIGGAISVNTNGASGDVTLINATAIDLAASSIGGILDARANAGNITDSGIVTISGSGASEFTTATGGADINLDTTNTSAGSIGVNTTDATGDAVISSNAAINLDTSTLGGSLTLISDDIDLVGGAGSVVSGGGSATITFNSLNAGTSIGVGTGAGTLSINATDLAGIGAFFGGINIGNAAGTAALTIGDAILPLSTTFTMTGAGGSIVSTGGTTLSAPGSNNLTLNAGSVSLAGTMNAGTGTVRIVSAGAVNQTAGSISASGLGVRAAGAVTLNQSNSVTTFAANSSGAGSAVQFAEASGLDLGTISALGAFSATSGITTSNGDVLVSAGGALTIPQSISAGSGTVRLASTGAVTQSGGSITAGSLGVRGGGAITLNQASNNTGTFAATTSSGNVGYVDADALTVGSVSTSGTFASVSGVTSAGTLSVATPGALTINNNITATTSFTLSSDTDGNAGNLSFGAGVTTASPSQTFRAGNGTGSATADMLTNNPTFQGTTAGTSPTTFIVRQDGAIEDDALNNKTAAGTQFAGGLNGLDYTLRSDNNTVTIDTASKVNGSCLTLSGTSIIINPVLNLECLNVNGPITLNNSLTMTEDTTFSGAVTIGGNITISTGTGTLTFGSTVSGGANDFTLEADELQINDNVSGTGTLTLQPFTPSRGVDLAQTEGSTPGDPTAGIFDLTANELGRVQNGFTLVNIGRDPLNNPGTGAMRAVNGTVFSDPLDLRMSGTGGTIAVNSLMVNDGGAITFSTPATTLGSTIRTNAGVVTFGGTLAVSGSAAVDTTDNTNAPAGANIVFGGDVNSSGGNNVLVVAAGTNGDVTFNGNVGGTTPLASLGVVGRNIALRNVSTTLGQSYDGITTTLSGNLTSTTIGDIGIVGDLALAGADREIRTEQGGVSVSGTTNGAFKLTAFAKQGDVTFTGDIGGVTPLSQVSFNGDRISVQNVTTTGEQGYTGTQGVTLSGDLLSTTSGEIAVIGNTTLAGATRSITTTSGAITLGGTVDGPSALTLLANGGAVEITGAAGDSTPFTSLAATGTTVSVMGVRTSGVQTYTGPSGVTLGGSLFANSGAISVTGNTTLAGASQTVQSGGQNITFTGTIESQLAGTGANLSLNAGAGDVSVTGATGATNALGSLAAIGTSINVAGVRTTGAQTYTGNTSTSGDLVSTGSGAIGITGNLALSGAARTISTEVGAISVSGTTNGATALTLDANQGDVTLTGATGGSTSLTSLAIFGQNINLNSVTTTGDQGYTAATNFAVTLNGDLAATGAGAVAVDGPTVLAVPSIVVSTANQDVAFDGTVNGASILTINAGTGDVAISGVAGGATRLQSFAVTAARTTSAGINTTGGQTFTGSLSLGGDLTSSAGGDINVSGATTLTGANATISTAGASGNDVTLTGVNGSTADASSLVVNAGAGNASLGAVGATTRLGALNVTAANITADSLNAAGAVTLAGISTVTGNVAGGSLISTGTTTVGGAVTTVGDQTYTGNTSITGNVVGGAITVQSGAAAFGGNVTGASLAVTGGAATIAGNATTNGAQSYAGGAAIGGSVQASSLTVSGGAATIAGNAATTGAQSYAAGANVTGNVTTSTLSTGAASTFSGDVTASGAIDLTGASTLAGNVSGTSLDIDGAATLGNTAGARTLNLSSGSLFRGAVSITGTTTIDAGSGPIFFASTLNSADATPRDLTLRSDASGTVDDTNSATPFVSSGVRFTSSVGETHALGRLEVQSDRAGVPQAATIVIAKQYASGSDGARVSNASVKSDALTINAGQFVMGAKEKLTAFGTLTINAPTATLSDITTLGDLVVNATGITVNERGSAPVLGQQVKGIDPSQIPTDVGIDFVSGGKITFGSAPSGTARYCTNNPYAADTLVSIPAGGSGRILSDFGQETISSDFLKPQAFGGGTIGNTNSEFLALDLVSGGSVDNVASAVASAIPSDQSLGVPGQAVSLSAAVKELLAQIGIAFKESFDESFDAAAGMALYNDWPQTSRADVDDFSYKISVNRLSKANIDRVVKAYESLFGEDPALRNDRIAESQIALSKAMEGYLQSIGEREPDGLGFRAFIESSPDQAEALKVLNGLKDLFTAIDQLGLSPVEARVPRATISNQFSDVGLSMEQFGAAVTGQPAAEPVAEPAAQ